MEDKSGIVPTGHKVLIRPEDVEQKTAGGIIIPDDKHERDEAQQMHGVLVACSPHAFDFVDWASSTDEYRPKPGDKIIYAKYAGAKVTGKDGVDYRLCNDKDVAAIVR